MNRSRTVFASALAGALLLAQGCASTKVEYNIVIPRSGAPVIEEDDAPAARLLMISRPPVFVKAPSGKPKAQVGVMNLSDRPLEVRYRFLWFDRNGLDLEPERAETVAVLEPGMEKTLSGVCRSDKAADFKISLRIPR